MGKELRIDENLDQVVSSLPEDSCERLLAEALETTVLAETCKKEDVWITSPPDVLEDDNLNDNNDDDDDDDKFEEMSKQKHSIEDDNDDEDDSNETFEEMTKVNNHCHDETEDDDDDNDMTMFKIKEDDNDEDDVEDDNNDEVLEDNLIDVETTATSAVNLAKSVDLLGNDI